MDGSAWSPANTATRSPAWAIAYCAKRIGLPDSRIDPPACSALDAVWSARGDSFDGRFDSVGTWGIWSARSRRPGAQNPSCRASILYVARSGSGAAGGGLRHAQHRARLCSRIEFVTPTPDTADAVEVSYFDEDAWRRAASPPVAPAAPPRSRQGRSVRLCRPRPGVPRRASTWPAATATAHGDQVRDGDGRLHPPTAT